jgi:hypothetical protein
MTREITSSVVPNPTKEAHIIKLHTGPALAVANITTTNTSLDTEPKLYLTSDPLSRPYDVAFHPNNPNHHLHNYNTVCFDITIANVTKPLPPTQNLASSEDCITTLTAHADTFLQDFERRKLNRSNNTRANPPIPGEAVIGDLLRSNRLLI